MTDSGQSNHDDQVSERDALAELLGAGRPVPSADFRGALGRYLDERDPGYGPRPTRLRSISFACLVASVALLALAALQATGVT